ncbi:putative LRR protein [Phytophthora megakarya]|uniref:Putative LRR protein n=1 Tax=Phytophthora megakarya TaxID=4795 RepID=A0A225UJM0_9STRA|nr:putative LRR protein [Phytophthora megakarya]
MGNTAIKAREAHAQAKSKPKNSRSVQQQKLKSAKATGVLALPNSKLKKLPDELWQLSTLRSLDLSGNKLSELPPQLSSLATLKTLKVSSNVLAALPDLSPLQALTTLVLDGNVLEDLPLALPPNLIKLSLKGNKLRAVPRSILSLVHLQELDLILSLVHLQELDLSDNALDLLPANLGEMQELQDLNVDDNQLAELPAALARCAKLKLLSARRNSLVGKSAGAKTQPIAAQLLQDSAVQVMNLDGNPMTKEDLQAMDGFDAFLTRRTKLKNKEIHGGLNSDLSLCGLA